MTKALRVYRFARYSIAITAIALVVGLTAHWHYEVFSAQANNSIQLQDKARELNGRCATLPMPFSHRDWWGREILWVCHNNGRFAIVSFGRDGVPDRPDYSEFLLNESRNLERTSTCFSPDMDTIFFETGAVQACLH